MIITQHTLLVNDACNSGRRRFHELFPPHDYPHGVRVTIARCVKHADDFDWYWAVETLLPGCPSNNVAAFERLLVGANENLAKVYRVNANHHTCNVDDYDLASCLACVTERRAEHEWHVAEARAFAQLVRDPRLRVAVSTEPIHVKEDE